MVDEVRFRQIYCELAAEFTGITFLQVELGAHLTAPMLVILISDGNFMERKKGLGWITLV